MKWTKLKAEHFGPLRRWEGDIREPFAVFYGKNEAGKSTMMELMCTLLFGAHKKKADAKKFITWGSPSAQIQGILQRDDGTSVELHRTIRLTGMRGAVQDKGTLTDLGDRPLPWLAPVDRELYRNIYALSLYDLLFPGQEAWALTQDQLLSGTSGQHRPASQVREELYRSAMSLWRPDRRGKTRMEELDTQLRELYDRLYQSQEDRRRISELEESGQACQQQIEELRQRQQQIQDALEEAMALREKASRLQEGRELLEQAGDIERFDSVPDDVEERIESLRTQQRELARQVAESGRALAQLNNQMERFTFREERILEHAEEIDRLCEQLPMLETTAQTLPLLMGQVQDATQAASQCLNQELQDPLALYEPDSFSASELISAANQVLNTRLKLLSARDELMEARKKTRSALPWVVGSLGLVFLLGSAVLFPPFNLMPLSGISWLSFGAAFLLGAAGVAMAAPLSAILKKKKTKALQQAVTEAEIAEQLACSLLTDAAKPLHPRVELLADIHKLSAYCEKYASLVLERDELAERCRKLQDRSLQDSSQIQALARDLLPEPGENALSNLKALNEALKNARHWQQENEDIYERMSEERTRLSQLKLQQQQSVDEEQELMNLLFQIPGEEIAQKLQELQLRRQAAARGAALLQSPDAANIPPLDEVDTFITTAQSELDDLLDRLQELYNTQGAVSQKLEQLKLLPPEEELEDSIKSVTEQRAQLTRQRDEEALLFALIKVSEQRFRDQHQPDVVRRASAYLSQITGGRYSRIVMTEDQQGIRIYSPDAGEFIDPTKNRLSQGTSEQVFLSLRLGLVDHLDPEGESLPLLLDETFVNWDHDRLVRGLAVLAQVASHRQLILFTCHPWMTKALDEAGCRYQLIDMEGK